MVKFRLPFVGYFDGKLVEKICLKAPLDYSASFWTSNFPICLWERPKTLHSHDFETFGRVREPHNQYYLSFETPRALQLIQEKAQIIFRNISSRSCFLWKW